MSVPVPPYVEGHGLLKGKSVLITAAAGVGIGFAAAKNSRSAAFSRGPAQPTISAVCAIGAGVETPQAGVKPAFWQRWKALVALDDALAAGRLEILAHLIGLIAVRERPDHGAVEGAAVAQVHPLEGDLRIAEHIRVFRLQLPPGCLGVLFALL